MTEDDWDMLARIGLSEAANQGGTGLAAVFHAIKNRQNAGGYGSTIGEIVTSPKQFTSYGNRNYRNPSPDQYKNALGLAQAVFDGRIPDMTGGATHFANVRDADPVNQRGWIAEMQRNGTARQIGAHTFGSPDSAPGRQASALTFEELPDGPAGLTFEELPDAPAEADPKGRIAQAHDSAIMAGGERATRQDLADRMNLIAGEKRLTGEDKTGPTAKGAASRGLLRGPFLGFGDELGGAVNAAGAFIGNLAGGQGAAGEAAGRAYTNTVEADRIMGQMDAANNPIARGVGEVGGSLGAPIGPLGTLVTKGAGAGPAFGRASEALVKGGAIGAISGAGHAEGGLDQRLAGAGGGAAIGGALGAASRPVGAAVGYVAKPAANTLRGIFAPNSEAERRIVSVASKGGGPSVQEVDDALAAGKPLVVGDIGGAPLRTLARSAKNQSTEAAEALETATAHRYITQSERMADEVGSLSRTGGNTSTVDIRAGIQASGKAASSPVYSAAYKAGDRGIWNPEIERLTSSPAMVAAMKAAVTRGKDRAVTEGYGGFNPSVTINQADEIVFAKGKNGQPTYPNLQYWDYTKKELDRGAKMAIRAGDNDGAAVLSNLAQKLRTSLDGEVPLYGKARSTYAAFAGADDAAKAGENFVTQPLNGKNIGLARRSLSQMSLNEREVFKESFISGLKAKLASIPENQDVTKKILHTKASREQIEMALGKGGADKLEADLHIEKIMQKLNEAVKGNSTTAQQLLAAGIGESAGQYFGWSGGVPGLGATAGLLTRAGIRRADRRIMQRVGETLASGDPELIKRLARTAAGSPAHMSVLRQITSGLTASPRAAGVTGGQGAPAASGVLAGPRGALAEEEQPK